MGRKLLAAFDLRRFLALVILASAAWLGLAIWQHWQMPPEEVVEDLSQQVDLSLKKFDYTHNENGQRSWTLRADKADYQRAQGEARLEQIQLTVYRAGQFGEVVLNAGQGRLLQEQQQIEVWDNVELQTSRNENMWTERLSFDGQLRQIYTEETVRFQSPHMELTGQGLLIDLDDGRLKLRRHVRMLLNSVQKERHSHE